jgi:hypothetical protein
VSSPFETEREARAAALEAGGPPRPGWVILSAEQNRGMLTGACKAAGVPLGAYDARILAWFAGFEDAACAVIAGLISRAHAGALSEEQAAIEAEGLARLADRIDAQLADEGTSWQGIAEDAVVQLRALGRIVRDGLGPRRVVLDEGQEAIVLDALAVAAEYRRYRASLTCQACNDHPAGLCEDHQADLDAAGEYDELAGRIGGAR